jgi:hypothetical protein
MRRDCSIAAAKTFSTADATSPGLKPSRGGEEQHVVLALMVGLNVAKAIFRQSKGGLEAEIGGTGPLCRPKSAKQRSRPARKCAETGYCEDSSAPEGQI